VIEEQQDDPHASSSSAYLVWPLALATLLRENPAASYWSRIHTRQALTFGLLTTIGYLVLLAVPMLIVIGDAGISTGTTVVVYGIGLTLDLLGFIAWAYFAFSYAARATRGELFAIPLVSQIADRLFKTE
jgi:uncharacterized membrane protein